MPAWCCIKGMEAGVYGNRTHRELCSNPPLVLKTRAPTRGANTPRPRNLRVNRIGFQDFAIVQAPRAPVYRRLLESVRARQNLRAAPGRVKPRVAVCVAERGP